MCDCPTLERRFNLIASDAPNEWPSAFRPYKQKKRCVGSGDCFHTAPHRCPLVDIEVVERAGIKDEPKPRPDARLGQFGDIALDQSHLDASLTHPVVRASEGLLDDVDASHLPSSPCQGDTPDATPRADVESAAERSPATLFLSGEQFGRLPDKRGIARRILPRMEPDGVCEPIVHVETEALSC